MLLLTYPGYRPKWAQWDNFRHGWPAMKRLRASLSSTFATAYAQVKSVKSSVTE